MRACGSQVAASRGPRKDRRQLASSLIYRLLIVGLAHQGLIKGSDLIIELIIDCRLAAANHRPHLLYRHIELLQHARLHVRRRACDRTGRQVDPLGLQRL